MILERIDSNPQDKQYELCEVCGTLDGQTRKERALDGSEYPVAVALLWPRIDDEKNFAEYRFVFREKATKDDINGLQSSTIDAFLQKFLGERESAVKDYPDLCMLPELTEKTLLDNLRDRFNAGNIYTYIGPILVAVNPYTLHPIYNPKYVKLYQNCYLRQLPPHIFAIGRLIFVRFVVVCWRSRRIPLSTCGVINLRFRAFYYRRFHAEYFCLKLIVDVAGKFA